MKNGLLQSYKGVRDFYPEDQFVQDYVIETWGRVVESFGFEKYHASVLEHADLYRNKSSEEIVNEQTYIFKDRGGREVVLRPEMTPTVTRMVANKRRELGYPLRLYSVPNVFRYERPQKGRLREHWQLNVDIFNAKGIEYELELIEIAHSIMKEFGAQDDDFVVKINSRAVLDKLFDKLDVPEIPKKSTLRLLDRKDKMKDADFKFELRKILANQTDDFLLELEKLANSDELKVYVDRLAQLGIENVMIDTSLVRGFDYYTGFIFEIFDTDPQNPRALFGGGRYDKLMEALGEENMPALGFGMGDVGIVEFLKARNLLPNYVASAELAIVLTDNTDALNKAAHKIAAQLRQRGINVAVNYSEQKLDKKIKNAQKLKIPFVLVLGEDELQSGKYKVKRFKDSQTASGSLDDIAEFIFESEV